MGYLSCNAESAIAVCDPYNWDRRKKSKSKNRKAAPSRAEPREFFYSDLLAATRAFSADSFLGKGSHGAVYRAVLDRGKLVAAVKRTTSNSHADNEIEILSRVFNPRLVNLIGFCADEKNRKLIVVEYMPNGSLCELLHSCPRPPSWTRRIRFALQVAKAVRALHGSEPPVIHRDIKSSNILIDDGGNARLGDFGLALRGHVEDVHVKCTPPAGTLGYLDPAYLAPSDVSTKSDVFSYGILLLEMVSGRHAIDLNYSPPSIVDWAVPLIRRGDFSAICDARLGPPADPEVIRSLATLAARCVRSSAEKRPSMSEIVECLKLVTKRAHEPRVWGNLRRRRRVNKPVQRPSLIHQVFDGTGEEVVGNPSRGSRRNSRKVSSVTSVDYGSDSTAVVRSKSIGSYSEASGASDGHHAVALRLSKSRSMGMLHNPRLVRKSSRRLKIVKADTDNSFELDISKLNIRLDEESERKMLEKPLVFF